MLCAYRCGVFLQVALRDESANFRAHWVAKRWEQNEEEKKEGMREARKVAKDKKDQGKRY